MGTRLVNLVVDAAMPAASARWWADALGWRVTLEQPDEVVVEPPEPGGLGIPLVFVPSPTPTGSTSTWPARPPPTRRPWSSA
jgi:Glyoxalase-like domain